MTGSEGLGRVSLGVQGDKSPTEYARLATMAEECGFDTISVYNDLGFQPAIYPLLMMARETARIRLGAACYNPYLTHPVEMAGQVAALDLASGGRAYLGLTRGAWLDRVGLDQPRPLRAMRETVDVVRCLLSGTQEGYFGQMFHLEAGTSLQYAVQRGDVDVLMGTWGPRGARLAAECADEVKLGGCANPDMVTLMRDWLDTGTQRVGRDTSAVGVVAGAVTVVDEDARAARSRARAEVAMYLPVVAKLDPTVSLPDDLCGAMGDLVAEGKLVEAGALIPDEVLSRFCIAGTPAEIVEKAEVLFDAGASRVEFGTPHG
ncbi:MAG: LLM class flavin-dependent oxidoreductase, partial [Nocardioidaceae bacterium]